MATLQNISLEKYDLKTYWGRFLDMNDRMNLKNLFYSKESISKAQDLITKFETKQWNELQSAGIKPCELKNSYSIVKSNLHAGTGELIPWPLRLCSFSPMNVPICAGILLSAPTVPNLVFWQLLNQTFNACFNYAHSNREKDGSKEKGIAAQKDLLLGYAAASVVSVGLAVGLNLALKKRMLKPLVKSVLQKAVPFVAVSSAGAANLVLMRHSELKKGVPVYSPKGEYIGHSKRAAAYAITQSGISRMLIAVPILAIPPIFFSLFSKVSMYRHIPALRVSLQLAVLFGSMRLGLPASIAVFPESSRIHVQKLEPHLIQSWQNLNDKESDFIDFHRGL